ncbi:MAG: twin-arginine translocase TatA/TatE family subunit [Acidimicrobiales bacterium]
MLSLNPEKLFIVLIVALVLLGPDKLPKLARQLGAGWTKVKAFQQRMEAEVRETIPELPSSHEIARIVRSPVSYLNSMAGPDSTLVPDPAAPRATGEPAAEFPLDPAAPAPSTNGHSPAPPLVRPVAVPGHHLPADPGMN